MCSKLRSHTRLTRAHAHTTTQCFGLASAATIRTRTRAHLVVVAIDHRQQPHYIANTCRRRCAHARFLKPPFVTPTAFSPEPSDCPRPSSHRSLCNTHVLIAYWIRGPAIRQQQVPECLLASRRVCSFAWLHFVFVFFVLCSLVLLRALSVSVNARAIACQDNCIAAGHRSRLAEDRSQIQSTETAIQTGENVTCRTPSSGGCCRRHRHRRHRRCRAQRQRLCRVCAQQEGAHRYDGNEVENDDISSHSVAPVQGRHHGGGRERQRGDRRARK